MQVWENRYGDTLTLEPAGEGYVDLVLTDRNPHNQPTTLMETVTVAAAIKAIKALGWPLRK